MRSFLAVVDCGLEWRWVLEGIRDALRAVIWGFGFRPRGLGGGRWDRHRWIAAGWRAGIWARGVTRIAIRVLDERCRGLVDAFVFRRLVNEFPFLAFRMYCC